MSGAAAYRVTPGGLTLWVRVTPNAGVDRIEGIESRDNGEAVLRLRVGAVPDKGRANAAVIALIARALGVPKSAIELTAGTTSRLKTLQIHGDSRSLAAQLDGLGRPPA